MKVVTSPQRWVCLVLGLVGLVAVSACSSSGDGGGGGTPTVAAPVQGVFVDSPVQGLGYLTQPSGLSGVTNANGQFNYNPGDTVTFNLFGQTIGSAVPATPVVTALSVFGATSMTDPRVLNLSQLLLTLGGIPAGSNPIVIPATPPAGFPATLDFSASNFDTLFPGLVSEAIATTHLQANFSTLSVVLAGGGASGGTVTSTPAGIACGAVCSADFFKGTAVSLTAAGAGFTGWSGACTGTGACVVTLNAAASVTATFASAPVMATVTVTKAGSGSGIVTSSPAGINCGATCSASLVQGTVDLTATALPGSTFAGWSNGTGNASCTGTSTCSIPLTVDSGVTATFTPIAVPVSVTANIASGNGGGGSVQCSADGGAAGPCGSYLPGAAVVMTATPNAISNFTGWSGAGCSGTGTCNFTLAASTTVTANFNRPTLTVQVSGAGSVSSSPTGINACTTNCTAPFDKGIPVTLTAGTGFTSWSGGGCSGAGNCVVTLSQSATVTANFGGGVASSRVIYVANQDRESYLDIYLAQSGVVTRLNSLDVVLGPASSNIFSVLTYGDFEVLPNWTGVVHSGGSLSTFTNHLYRSSFVSPGSSQLTDRSDGSFRVFPDNSGAVYHRQSSLYVTNFSSGTSTRLTPEPPVGTNQVFGSVAGEFELIPDMSGVIYLGVLPPGLDCGLVRVNFSTPGSVQRITSPTLTSCLQSDAPYRWHLLPDSSGVVIQRGLLGRLSLIRFSNPGIEIELGVVGDLINSGFTPLLDSTGIVYSSAQTTLGLTSEMYLIRFSSPTVSVKLGPALPQGPSTSGIKEFHLALDGSGVVYAVSTLAFGVQAELHKVAFANPSVSQRLTPIIAGGHFGVWGCESIKLIPDGTGAVFLADIDSTVAGAMELYKVNFAAPGIIQRLNAGSAVGDPGLPRQCGHPYAFQLPSDSTGVVYQDDQDTLGVYELYRVNFSSPGVSTKLSGPLAVGRNVVDFRAE